VKVIVFIPSSPAFMDIRSMYESRANSSQWLWMVPAEQAASLVSSPLLYDPDVLFVSWDIDMRIPRERRCRFGIVYSEAVSSDEGPMLPDHLATWKRALADADDFDVVFGHAPGTNELLTRHFANVEWLPVGWDPRCAVPIASDDSRTVDVMTWGSLAGRRRWILPLMQDLLQKRGIELDVRVGLFGHRLIQEISTAKFALYIAHSEVDSFSTWRLGQCLTAGTPLIAENAKPENIAPFRACFPCPLQTPCRTNAWADQIATLVSTPLDLQAITDERERVPTIDHVLDHYLKPAAERTLAR
jgi:hypothetical protein